MSNHFKFLALPGNGGSVANVFIHGYSAGHDLNDRRLLASSIPASLREGTNVLAFWPSSHFTELDNRSRGLLMAAARVHLLAGAAALAGDRAWHFARIRTRAERMGKVLLGQLAKYLHEKHPQVTHINLIGHSLGGRLLVSALRDLQDAFEHGLLIRHVLLMGAAVRVDARDAEQFKQRISGRLINAWSTEDHVLLLNLGEKSLGRTPVQHFENFRMPGYRHNHYWRQLRQVLSHTGFCGISDQEADLPLLTDTPADPIRQDVYLHGVLERSSNNLLEQAIKHLRSSRWTDLKDSETDRVYAFVREFQLVGGHCLVNAARRRGVSYTRVLGMLARQYDLGEALHQCATVVEVEELLLRTFFQHAFADDHPLALAPRTSIGSMAEAVYFQHIDALAERLTIASYFRPTSPELADCQPDAPASQASSAVLVEAATGGRLRSLLTAVRKAPVQRLLSRFNTAFRPGYSALIPAVAIVFYARIRLGDESLM